jgi:hypothetical protein
MRTIEEIANSTPKDYLEHTEEPEQIVAQMMLKAQMLFPKKGEIVENGHRFLYVGPGSGQIVKRLIERDQKAFGLETSKRGIASAPDEVRAYVNWSLPWETSYADKFFNVAFVNPYFKTLLKDDEWTDFVKELNRASRYAKE